MHQQNSTRFLAARHVAEALKPDQPITVLHNAAPLAAAGYFRDNFQGKTLYAVKANPSPALLQLLWTAGITHYDVASINEVRLVRQTLPEATLCFMHPVKSPEAIGEAYHVHGVRSFSLDMVDELAKIVTATGHATDLTLLVRLRVSSDHSKLSLAAKFGASPDETPALLLATRQVAERLGVCFHVGSQAMSPKAYADALHLVGAAIVKAAVTVDVVDVGGGFPSVYPGMEPPALMRYFDCIHQEFEALPVSYSAELWCEPGRALSAEYASLLVRVEQRRGTALYINDGAYGSLFDAAHVGWRFPVKLLRESSAGCAGFSFYGPTCDDIDHMAGPFELPADVKAGDYIEIGMVGAYGSAMQTNFNGFVPGISVEVDDAPMLSLYHNTESQNEIFTARVKAE